MSEYRRLQSLAERQAALASDAETRRALEAIADDYSQNGGDWRGPPRKKVWRVRFAACWSRS